jgi:hypothetical protein
VQNDTVNLSTVAAAVRGCERLEDVRGVPAIALGGGLTVVTAEATVTIFKSSGGALRAMAEQLRPVGGSADVTLPLPAPPKYILAAVAEACGAMPGDHGPPIDE